MDLTSALLAEAIRMGMGGLILLAAVFYLVKRDNRMQSEDRTRTDRSHVDLRETIDANKSECSQREANMTDRIRHLEDQRHTEGSQLLARTTSALEIHARVLEMIVDDKSGGLHRAITGKTT